MPDYQKGKIYKLWSPQGDEIYIGSTINSLAKRLGHHKIARDCRSKYLFENYDDVRIELIEEYSCDNKMELNKKEGEHIRNNECLNRCIAGRTRKESHKEYYENNKVKVKEKNDKWRKDNPSRMKELQKEWYEKVAKQRRSEKFNCDCGSVIRIGYKTHHLKTKKHIDFTQRQQECQEYQPPP